MQIHHMLVAVNQISALAAGVVLEFNQAVSLLEEGDAIIARFTDGREVLMMVQSVAGLVVTAHATTDEKRTVHFTQSAARSLTVVA